MTQTTNKKQARARLLERQAAAAAAREALQKQNIEDLSTFMVATAKADGVDAWLAERVEKLKQDAEARRAKHRIAAGRALQAMRFRGETISGIATEAGVSAAKVREFLKLAADAGTNDDDSGQQEVLAPVTSIVPTPVGEGTDGQEGSPEAVVAQ